MITPIEGSWTVFESLAVGSFFRLSCVGIPGDSRAFLQFQEWRDQRPSPIKILHCVPQQLFHWGPGGERLITIRKAYPLKGGRDSEDFQVSLEEWSHIPDHPEQGDDIPVVEVKPPEVNLWLPGSR